MLDTSVTLEQINLRNANTLASHLGIEFTEFTQEYLKAKMPVDTRTIQPLGLLNGGASAALAETLGSTAAYLALDRTQYYCVGLEIKCNHLRSATKGYVEATATPIHIGKKTQVWNIQIVDENQKLVCFSVLTMAVLELTEEQKQHYKDLFKS